MDGYRPKTHHALIQTYVDQPAKKTYVDQFIFWHHGFWRVGSRTDSNALFYSDTWFCYVLEDDVAMVCLTTKLAVDALTVANFCSTTQIYLLDHFIIMPS
jgi:hypothetical protein